VALRPGPWGGGGVRRARPRVIVVRIPWVVRSKQFGSHRWARSGARWCWKPSELQLLPRHVTVDPNDTVTTHDRVHRIGLLRERRCIRGRDLRSREVVEAALAVRVAVDDPHGASPPCILARLPGEDARGC